MKSIRKGVLFCRKYPILDLLFLGLMIWRGVRLWGASQLSGHMESTDRTLALTALSTEIQAGITGTSILIAAIAVFGVRRDAEAVSGEASEHFRIALLFSIISLLAGVFNLGTLPSIVNTENVALDFQSALTAMAQVWLMIGAAIRTAFGIWRAIKRKTLRPSRPPSLWPRRRRSTNIARKGTQ